MIHSGATGKLHHWPELTDRVGEGALLLGNGLSVHVSPKFDYTSLFEEASTGGLKSRDRRLFDRFGTKNFEAVLEALATAISVCEVFNRYTTDMQRSYERVQAALGSAVRSVHVDWNQVEDETREQIQGVLSEHEAVFTTSYDMLVYWSMACNGFPTGLCDMLWGCEFDPNNVGLTPDKIPVYYLHGALHLVVGGDRITRKHKQSVFFKVLDRFGRLDPDDPKARPLLVTEGSSSSKLRAIEGNDYLSFCLDSLERYDAPITTFGFSFGSQDRHISAALNQHPERVIVVGMQRVGTETELKARQSEVQTVLPAAELYFYDAATHPLGRVTPAKT